MHVTATIGVLGGGQLGRMLALAGIPLGMRFRFLETEADCPAAGVGEVIVGAYDDERALERFADGIDVATYEFENVPAATARWLTDHVPVFPPEGVLAVAQDRLREKGLFNELGIETPRFEPVDSPDDLRAAAEKIGLPSILKTRRFGYDGKGQWMIRSEADLARLTTDAALAERFAAGAPADLILEGFVPFARELSVLGVRSRTGQEAFYPLTQNVHREGVLRESVAPAPRIGADEQARGEEIARRVLERTNYVGVLAVELFEMPDGRLLANEMAPRVHNSGHWTMDAGPDVCSQFENHLRALMGWPLGPTMPPKGRSFAMLNLLRTLPRPEDALRLESARLHLYNKPPRPGALRKIGHLNVSGQSEEELEKQVNELRPLT